MFINAEGKFGSDMAQTTLKVNCKWRRLLNFRRE